MKRAAAAIALVFGALTLAGCAQTYGPNGQGVSPVDMKLSSGQVVTCVVASSGGVDCDWDRAK